MSSPEESNRLEQHAREDTPSDVPRTVRSDELLRGARELLIRHGEELYRLRLTRNGKLILQK